MNSPILNINGNSVETLEILFIMTLITLAPSIVIMMSSFLRIVVVLSFTRTSMGIQQTPPNMVLIGIALFLTFFIMNPVIQTVNSDAYAPYKRGEISQIQALKRAEKPLKRFMLKQTDPESLNMFVSFSREEKPINEENLPLTTVIPAFVTSELKKAFIMGFLIFIPFLIIDIIVSSTLMSMGMMMLPPATISLPFKILLFILVDGWGLLFSTLVKSFNI